MRAVKDISISVSFKKCCLETERRFLVSLSDVRIEYFSPTQMPFLHANGDDRKLL